jgi:hypothetical protein
LLSTAKIFGRILYSGKFFIFEKLIFSISLGKQIYYALKFQRKTKKIIKIITYSRFQIKKLNGFATEAQSHGEISREPNKNPN